MEKEIERILRVNQAGEYGAVRIYEGQRWVIGQNDPLLKKMYLQEKKHLKIFNQLMIQNEVSPTVFQPFWHMGGFFLGVCTALMGRRSAHACTIAVESVIDQHYANQLKDLEKKDEIPQTLIRTIEECHKEELEHLHEAQKEGGNESLLYPLIYKGVRFVTKLSIFLSQRY